MPATILWALHAARLLGEGDVPASAKEAIAEP